MEHQDQAEQLRKAIQRENDLEGIMASQLPTRSEYHKNKRSKGNQSRNNANEEDHQLESKPKYPMKILVFIFLMLPILVGTIYYFQFFKSNNNPVTIDRDSDYFDSVEFE